MVLPANSDIMCNYSTLMTKCLFGEVFENYLPFSEFTTKDDEDFLLKSMRANATDHKEAPYSITRKGLQGICNFILFSSLVVVSALELFPYCGLSCKYCLDHF